MVKSPVNTPLPCVLVTTSVPTAADAGALAALLVDRRLAACVTYTPIRSCYLWNGERVVADEVQVTIKTHPGSVDDVVAAVTDWHPYDTPELLVLSTTTTERYGTWLAATVNNDGIPPPRTPP